MEEKGRGGKTALHILAFIGITLALLIIAALAALYIATKGPSDAARDSFVGWCRTRPRRRLPRTVPLRSEEKDATGGGDPADDVQPESSDVPMIIVSEEAPEYQRGPGGKRGAGYQRSAGDKRGAGGQPGARRQRRGGRGMSDDKYNFEFHGLSDDEELERLLESVRRDIGEASPEPRRSEPQPRRAESAAAPERTQRPQQQPEARAAAPHAQQLRQARPNTRAGSASGGEQPRRQAAVAEKDLPPQRERIRVVHPEDERPERKKSRFGLAFGIYTAVLALVLIAGCVLLWFYLGSYEATRPEQVMEDFSQDGRRGLLV